MTVHQVPNNTAGPLVELLDGLDGKERLVCAPVSAGDRFVVVTEPLPKTRTTEKSGGRTIER